MYSRVELITPEMATMYLEKNTHNRKVKQEAVRRYANDMKNGNWQLNNQGIAFHKDGSLADGQHRLLAIVLSKTAVEMLVTYDVPDETTLFDRGVIRSTADILTLNGFAADVANTVAVSAVNFLFVYCKGRAPTDAVMSDFCEKNHELIVKAVSVCGAGSSNKKIARKAPIMAAAFCALYCGVPEEGLREFFSVVNTGFSSGRSQNAAIVLRNYLLTEYGRSTMEEKRYLFNVTTQAICDFAKGFGRVKRYQRDTLPTFYKFVKGQVLDHYFMS